MSLSMYQASVPVFRQILTSLSGVLQKGAAHAEARRFVPAVLLQTRLYPDMLPLVQQVQIATDHAKGACARLAGVEVPRYADTEAGFEELQARLAKTLDFIGGLAPAQIDGSEEREITMKIGPQTLTMVGRAYLLHFALPNAYFHATMAYALLRQSGVEIGKRDFIGRFDPA
jgi:hypothetical protein